MFLQSLKNFVTGHGWQDDASRARQDEEERRRRELARQATISSRPVTPLSPTLTPSFTRPDTPTPTPTRPSLQEVPRPGVQLHDFSQAQKHVSPPLPVSVSPPQRSYDLSGLSPETRVVVNKLVQRGKDPSAVILSGRDAAKIKARADFLNSPAGRVIGTLGTMGGLIGGTAADMGSRVLEGAMLSGHQMFGDKSSKDYAQRGLELMDSGERSRDAIQQFRDKISFIDPTERRSETEKQETDREAQAILTGQATPGDIFSAALKSADLASIVVPGVKALSSLRRVIPSNAKIPSLTKVRPTSDPNSPIFVNRTPTANERPAITSPNRPRPHKPTTVRPHAPEVSPRTLPEFMPRPLEATVPTSASSRGVPPNRLDITPRISEAIDVPQVPKRIQPEPKAPELIKREKEIQKALDEVTTKPAKQLELPISEQVESPITAKSRQLVQEATPIDQTSVKASEATKARSEAPTEAIAKGDGKVGAVKESDGVSAKSPTSELISPDKEFTRLTKSYRDSVYAGDVKEFQRLVKGRRAQASVKQAQEGALREISNTPSEKLVSDAIRQSGSKLSNSTDAVKAQTKLFELNRISRQVGTDGKPTALAKQARDAEIALLNQIDEFASRSGAQLRSVQVAYEQMTPVQKSRYWKKKLKVDELDYTPEQEKIINKYFEQADNISVELHGTPDAPGVASRLRDAKARFEGGQSLSGKELKDIDTLSGKYNTLSRDYELSTGKAVKAIRTAAAENQGMTAKRAGEAVGNYGRQSMLSTVTGRVHDVLSTTGTAIDDLGIDFLQSVLAKGGNKLAGRNIFKQSTVLSPSEVIRGGKRGLRDLAGEVWTGVERVKDPARYIQEASINRGDLLKPRVGVSRLVSGLVRLPDAATRGMREAAILRAGRDAGKRLGLKGKSLDAYAKVFKHFPDSATSEKATAFWRKSNMMHDNKLTEIVEGVLGKVNSVPVIGGIMKNAILPFTRYSSGYANRLFMEKNPIARSLRIGSNIFKKNPDVALHQLAGLASDTTKGALMAGAILPALGFEITDHDEDGKKYSGLYLKHGNRYFSMTTLGLAAPYVVMSYLWNENAKNPDSSMPERIVKTGSEWIMTVALQADLAGSMGIGNPLYEQGRNLQDAFASDDSRKAGNAIISAVGSLVGQYIPGIGRDINAVLDQNKALNPTGERPETKVMETNLETGLERQNVLATTVNKLASQIPFASQSLERKPDTIAKNLTDRSVRGGRSTDIQEQDIAKAKETEARKKDSRTRDADYRRRGIPATDDGIKSALEKGDWTSAIEGQRWKLERAGDDGEISEETKTKGENTIKTYELFSKNKWSYKDYKAYTSSETESGGVGVTLWRSMLNPNSDNYDLERAEHLYAIDQAMVKAGLRKVPKYTLSSSSAGGGSGSKGRASTVVQVKGGVKLTDFGKPIETFKPIPDLKVGKAPRSVAKKTISVKRGVHV